MAMQKIMVVEDEEDILELLLFTLRRDDNAVTGAKSGKRPSPFSAGKPLT